MNDDTMIDYADKVVRDAEAWLGGIATELRPVVENALRIMAEASLRGAINPTDETWKRDINVARALLSSQAALVALDARRKANQVVADSLRFGINAVLGVLAA